MNLPASLTGWYFRPREREVALYRRLGVRCFKRYLPTGGDIYANKMGWHPVLNRTESLAASLLKLEKRTRLAEVGHLITFIFFAAVCVSGFSASGRVIPLLLVGAFNVGFNVYPIMVQRYNRHRILRLLQRCNAAKSGPVDD